jgi:hypothetical protein
MDLVITSNLNLVLSKCLRYSVAICSVSRGPVQCGTMTQKVSINRYSCKLVVFSILCLTCIMDCINYDLYLKFHLSVPSPCVNCNYT